MGTFLRHSVCQHLKKVSKTDVIVDKVDAEWLL